MPTPCVGRLSKCGPESAESEDGIELIDYIKSRWPSMKMLVSSAHDEKIFAGRVLRAGALGFISKREPLPQVVEAELLREDGAFDRGPERVEDAGLVAR